MVIRDDRDPTDLGLLSPGDSEALELRTRRRVPGGRADQQEQASRSIGPTTPAPGQGSQRVREHMAAIYAQMGWELQEVSAEEQQAREDRRRRRELQRRC